MLSVCVCAGYFFFFIHKNCPKWNRVVLRTARERTSLLIDVVVDAHAFFLRSYTDMSRLKISFYIYKLCAE